MKLNEIYIRDPFMLIEDGKYYLYGSTDVQCCGGKADGFKVYYGESLDNLTEKYVFKNDGNFWGDENYWAPEVHKYNGKFYMFATFHSKNSMRRCHILLSDTPDGTFKPLEKPLTPENWDSLDARSL